MPTNGTYNWSPRLIFGAIWTIFRAGAVPGIPGGRREPQGAENRPKTRGRIHNFILPKVFPVDPAACNLATLQPCKGSASGLGGRPLTSPQRHPEAYLRLEKVMQMIICIWLLVGFRPSLAPRPAPTGRVRKTVQNAPNISPGDQF